MERQPILTNYSN